MPIDLETPEAFLFAFSDNGQTYAVSVYGRTEAEARHRFSTMTLAERRARIVAGLDSGDRDMVADAFGWVAALFTRRPARRTV